MLKKRGNTYYVDMMVEGKRKRISTGTGDIHEAQRILPELLADMLKESHAAACGSITVSEGFERLMVEEWKHTRNSQNVRTHINEFVAMLGKDTPLESVDRTALVRCQQQLSERHGRNRNKPAAPATVNRKMATLIRLLSVAHAEWQIIGPPPRVRPMKTTKALVRALRDNEVTELLETARPEFRDAFAFLIETGARMGEFLALRWDAFDLDAGRLWLSPSGDTILKGDKGRGIPLTAGTRRLLKAQRDSGAPRPFMKLHRWNIRTEWDRIKKEMGLEHDKGFVPHALRHTCATRLINNGVPTSTVQKWLGHSSITTTTIYLDQNVDDMAVHAEAIAVQPTSHLRAVK